MSDTLLHAFEAGAVEPREFTHRAHVQTAAALLMRTDFLDAGHRYMAGLEQIARKAKATSKLNVTITLALLSLIGERLGAGADVDAIADEFADPHILLRWYSRERLNSQPARRAFLMPDLVP